MNRRESIKSILALGISPLFLSSNNIIESENMKQKPIHFVALGGGGTNALKKIHSKGINAKYSYVSDVYRSIDWANYVEYIPPKEENQDWDIRYFYIPREVKNIFLKDEKFIFLVGLGGYTGTMMTESLVNWLNVKQKDYLLITSLPYKFEGKKRNLHANLLKNKLTSV